MKEFKLEQIPAQSLSQDDWEEMRGSKRVLTTKSGRLAYGGLSPGLVNCKILDLSETGMRVETSAALSPAPEFVSVEFCEIYCRARLCWVRGKEIGLEFIFDGL
jgi:hypothetical protein